MTSEVAGPRAPIKVLVVDGVGSDGTSLVELGASTFEIKRAPGGLYALTMLERDHPHLIVTRFDLGDMTGSELCSMVLRDNALSDVRIVLLARHLDEKARAEREADFDLVLLGDMSTAAIEQRLVELARRDLQPAVASPAPSEAKVITGSLGVLSFVELTQAFSQTGKTGCLELSFDSDPESNEPAAVFFAQGKVRHAQYRDSRGVSAFARLFYDAEEATDTAFRFQPMPIETIAEQPRTIDRTAQQLLLSAAVDLDENETDEIALAELRRRMAAESDRSETEPGHDAPE